MKIGLNIDYCKKKKLWFSQFLVVCNVYFDDPNNPFQPILVMPVGAQTGVVLVLVLVSVPGKVCVRKSICHKNGAKLTL